MEHLILGLPPRFIYTTIEFVYFMVIVGLCLATYFKTKEIEELTGHKGITLFRNIFLFFSLAFVVRLIHMYLIINLGRQVLRGIPYLQRSVLLAIAFFSTIALLYLLAIILIKQVKDFDISNQKLFVLFALIAIAVIVPTIYFRTQVIMIAVQLALIASAGIKVITLKHSKKKKKRQFFNIKLLYILISIFWILNTLVTQRIISNFKIRVLIYLASIVIFYIIFDRVNKRLSSK